MLHLGDLDLLVLDSANACDQLPGLTDVYRCQLRAAAGRLRGHQAWLVAHRPIWGIEDAGSTLYGCDGQPESGPTLPYGELNQTLQCALRGEAGKALLPALDQILAGYMHRFEALSFSAPTGRPPVLVVGNSGVAEDTGPPAGAFAQTVDGAPASGFSVAQYGYLELARDGSGAWHGSMVTLDPATWSPFLSPARQELWTRRSASSQPLRKIRARRPRRAVARLPLSLWSRVEGPRDAKADVLVPTP